MSEKDKGAILTEIQNLSEGDRQFVLGYAAGITAKSKGNDTKPATDEKKE